MRWGAVAAVLTIVMVAGKADPVGAQTFNPELGVTVANPEPETASDLITTLDLPIGDVQFAALVAFIPPEWGIIPGDKIPVGTPVGTLTSKAVLGLINSPCNQELPIEFPMMNASLDRSDTVSMEDTDDSLTVDFAEDADGNGLDDAIDRWPEFISRVVDEQPIRRFAGITLVAGTAVLLQFVIYEPGTLIDELIPNDPELGYPSVTFLQNAGDPDAIPSPGVITDFCTPLTTLNTTLGETVEGEQVMVNPQNGTYTFTTFLLGQRDADGDGYEDLFIGGAAGQAGRLFLASRSGRFSGPKPGPWDEDRLSEDMAPLWLDVDSDGDLDLYVTSGGVECKAGDAVLRDRLYLNDGTGHFTKAPADTLPDVADSSSVAVAADFDGDGDVDLFVGGRVIPGQYPLTPFSRLLRNDDGRFTDITEDAAPGLKQVGLVTGALWSDADGDGRVDLLLTLEWGPVQLWHNTGGRLEDHTAEAGLANISGWWNGITGCDLDKDGDIDYVVTNFGLNTKYHASPKEPALLYYGDLDGTGKMRIVEAAHEEHVLYPVRGRSCSSAAMPFIERKFPNFASFAKSDLGGIYTPQALAGVHKFEATHLRSAVLVNSGEARFEMKPLPRLAQAAPGFGVVATDFDGDSNPDVCIAQNFFSPQPETGRMDGGLSLLLRGDGRGALSPTSAAASGLVVPGDAKGLAVCDLNRDGWPDLAMTQNDGPLLIFINAGAVETSPTAASAAEPLTRAGAPATIKRMLAVRLRGRPGNPTALGARVSLVRGDGTRQTAEVYGGSGYLSQSTSWLFFGLGEEEGPQQLIVTWPDGKRSSHTSNPSESRMTIAYPAD
ncbi:MAG: CRTAC1 family protein [Acidobacteria bacterium]|nr:CRTAC1 family protein [Acidobacteriota bacterium]